jgi:hypothetical protein
MQQAGLYLNIITLLVKCFPGLYASLTKKYSRIQSKNQEKQQIMD